MTRRSRRRLTRRRDRHTPLLLVTDDHYPGETLEATARAVYRYRSELAPLAAALTLAAFGLYLHARHPGAWPTVAVLTAVTAALLYRAGRWLPRPAERSYAAATAVLAGAWLAVATAAGPGTPPLPAVLILGTLAAGIPWWTHRRRRARVRVERTLEGWPQLAESIGLPGARVLSAVVDRWGWRARIHLHRGQTVDDALSRLPAIESGLGTRRGAARVEAEPDRADRFVLRVLETDPHAEPIRWPGPSIASIAQPVELGVFEDATPVRVSLLRRHILVGGVTESGKSGVVNVVLGNLAACADAVVWGIDLKGGMELQPWAACLDRLATTPADAARLLADAVNILDSRAASLAESGVRLWQPAPNAPALVVLIDEYAELAEAARYATAHADSIARRGRAVAVTLLAATQRPTQQAMGSGTVRSQMDVRICLRVRERRDVDLILGQGMLAAGWRADALTAPGTFLISAPGLDTPRRARAHLVTDHDVTAAATRHAGTRPALDPRSAQVVTAPEPAPAEPADPPADPEVLLWTALLAAPAEGLSIAALRRATGKGRTWTYDRLQQHTDAGRVTQVSRGRWRAHSPDT
jgi:DNA segregation ATPase FtsK/SpoIIIE, S-DNA-T family